MVHIDTGHNFPEVIEFRDRTVEEYGLRLIVASVQYRPWIAVAAGLLILLGLPAFVLALPAIAALQQGDAAPDFTLRASLGGEEFETELLETRGQSRQPGLVAIGKGEEHPALLGESPPGGQGGLGDSGAVRAELPSEQRRIRRLGHRLQHLQQINKLANLASYYDR